jgi:hypothetical protein
MKRNVIFLDIDGVLNSTDYLPQTLALGWEGWKENIDPDRVTKLNRIIGSLNAMGQQTDVVLSSTWRFHFDKEDMTQMLQERGFLFEIIDVTPPVIKDRVEAILHWIESPLGAQYDNWIAIDDDRACWALGYHWIRTVDGLTDGDVEWAINRLRREI